MRKPIIEHALSVTLLLVVMLMSGCQGVGPQLLAGDVIATSPGTVRLTIETALAGNTGTHILTNGQLYMFARPIENGWSFIVIDSTGATVAPMNGNFTGTNDMTSLVSRLMERGWKDIDPSTVPAWMTAGRIINWLMECGAQFSTIIVVPAGVFENTMFGRMLVDPKS